MYILLILYFLFLLVYVAYNAYVIFRVNTMRIKGDLTIRGTIVYLLVITAILIFSIAAISILKWNNPIFNIGGGLGF